jgi:hypothetical protein
LSGQSFLFINDLGKPDSIFYIGKLPINILPILMTGFNLISGVIYTKGQQTREKVQVYGLAAIFLVLLYNSPSGLVLYWTMNNLYSMMKNVIMKLLANKIHLPKLNLKSRCMRDLNNRVVFRVYLMETVFISLFVGGVISLNVVNASPAEFITDEYGPIQLVINNISIYAGIFLVWGTIYFALMKPFARYAINVVLFCIDVISCVNYMVFGTNMGTLSSVLVYNKTFSFSVSEKIVNVLVIVALLLLALFIAIKLQVIQRRIMQVLALVVVVVVVINGMSLNTQVSEMVLVNENNNSYIEDNKIIHLSTSGNNVIVFMLDRAISGYIPFVFDEKSEIREAFEGFTYYPNTLSFGPYTNFASPVIFGGYEYMPTEMNRRVDESLKDKHDEALCVLPKLFSDEGYNVTVCSPPYAGYLWTPDLSIYDGIENVNAYDPCGWYTDEAIKDMVSDLDYKNFQQNSFFYYSLMKISPLVMQSYVYNYGNYWNNHNAVVYKAFMDEYATLTHLVDMTVIEDNDNNNVLIMQNGATHNITLLKTPEYEPEAGISTDNYLYGDIDPHTVYVDGIAMDLMNQDQTAHYQSNVASLKELANWFNYIKESGCWDNTRIIVVSDHGSSLEQFDYMQLSNGIDVEFYNPLLLVKDFGDTKYSVSDEFMTNGDVPTLALEGLIDNPINPYTGNIISSDAKNGKLYVTTSRKWNTKENNGNVFDTSDGEWYIVRDNIFDVNNWIYISD